MLSFNNKHRAKQQQRLVHENRYTSRQLDRVCCWTLRFEAC
ncbi:hypothetical protein [Ktedonobacter racemifer]|uniref:Uncharacterized protein n=1 Tax=Ktedonobacter racemifer DSM 44963 TaxID=485913 RepID=D6TJ95_KTERA|nr:hypothetical protein [Ktedonobacter racemifer]EFH89502.1 hypothetical protein Krac_11065 [Ktedonobacter racemifer DSM 44963]